MDVSDPSLFSGSPMISPKKNKIRAGLRKKVLELEGENGSLRNRLETLQIEHSSLQQKVGIMENSRGSVDIFKRQCFE